MDRGHARRPMFTILDLEDQCECEAEVSAVASRRCKVAHFGLSPDLWRDFLARLNPPHHHSAVLSNICDGSEA